MIELKDLRVAYGAIKALSGIAINVQKGQIVTLIGANGAGKSTTLRAISGIIKVSGGSIVYEGRDITNKPPHVIVGRGSSHVPAARMIFPNLTDKEYPE